MIIEAWNKYRSGEYNHDDHDETTGEAEESQDARCNISAKQTSDNNRQQWVENDISAVAV